MLDNIRLTKELKKVLMNGTKITIPETREELVELALGGKENKEYNVEFDINGKTFTEAIVTRCKNGIAVNYDDINMRRRDPNCMLIADKYPTDKERYKDRFGKDFNEIKEETLKWLGNSEELIVMPFLSGSDPKGELKIGYESLLIIPKNAAFFALALCDIQKFIPKGQICEGFSPKIVLYVAPTFRHTHFEKKQIVVHNRLKDVHEIFAYNLYPGPSAKKGIYGALLNIGENKEWTTLHTSAAQIITPYDKVVNIMHEGASGAGKTEMTEPIHYGTNGKVLLGINDQTKEKYYIKMTDKSQINPVIDDMALCHPTFKGKKGKLVIADAENAWFLRTDHINEYGKEPLLEKLTIHPPEPLIFFNIDAMPMSTCLIWEPKMDCPGKPCKNPRIIMPRKFINNSIDSPIEIDIRSFGIRQPVSTKNKPNYGIAGMFHILPPALAWIWRLVAPRGDSNPSILEGKDNEMESEGVRILLAICNRKNGDSS